MERKTKQVTCPTCKQVWTITKAGAEDFALMAALTVPDWFKDKTGEERFTARQVRKNMPAEAMWERALENKGQVSMALDIMQRYSLKPEIVPNDVTLPKTGSDKIHRSRVGVCCVACIPVEITNFAAEEAGLMAGFSDEGGDGEPGPDSAKVLDKSTPGSRAQGG